MKKKILLLSMIISASMTVNAFASFSIEGSLTSTRANEAVNINPWNTATYQGVGEGNIFTFYTSQKKVDVPLDYPLYRLSGGYSDKITCINGKWGIERNVGIKTFDGSENWSVFNKTAFQNDSTSVFTCSFGSGAPHALSAWCTHFDVYSFSNMKTTPYDGISFGENSSNILMRVMNVRNIKTVDSLKAYLKSQYDSGNPVKLLYCLDTPVFTPFDGSLQKEMASIANENVRYIDKNCIGVKYGTDTVSTSLFTASSSGNEYMDDFLSSVSGVQIFNCSLDKKFYVSGISKTDSGLTFAVNDSVGESYTAFLPYSDANFISNKTTELIFKGSQKEVIKMQVSLNLFHVPEKSISGFSYDTAGIQPSAIMQKSAVIPEKITATVGSELDFTNALLNSSVNYGDDIELFLGKKQVTKAGKLKVTKEGKKTYSVFLNGKNIGSTTVCAYSNDALDEKNKIMFFGDSLISQDLYTRYFKDISANTTLCGTIGTKDNLHEGRGGWSAYDYCHTSSKYGYTNPFLNNGKFDFAYYMKNNKIKKPDVVVIDLGINDLNLSGHNSHNEILSNFDAIEKSIHSYNKDIKIIINTPLMLFDTDTTGTAKNTRLNFVSALYSHYKDSENIYISPIYFNVDCYTDFKFEEKPLDEYNQSTSMTVTDTTHPNNGGYMNIAKATLSFIKSIE